MFHLICFLRQHPAQSVPDSPHIIVLLYFLCRLCLLLNMTSAGAFLSNFKSVPKPIILLCNSNVCLSKYVWVLQQQDWKAADVLFLFSLGYSGSVSLLFSTMCQFYSDVIAVWSAYGGDRQRFFSRPRVSEWCYHRRQLDGQITNASSVPAFSCSSCFISFLPTQLLSKRRHSCYNPNYP